MLRRLAPLVLLVALVAACGATSADAATAGSGSISEKSLRDELKITRDNPEYRAALEQQYQGKLAGASEGTFNSAYVAQLLSLRIYYSLIEQRLSVDHEKITDADRTEAQKAVDQQFQALGKGAAKLPKSYKDELVRREALINAASRDSQTNYLTSLKVACVSHILVDSKAKADALKAQLDKGADFAEVAKANSSDSSKDNGGDLGCQLPGTYVQEFEDAVQTLPIGKVSDPVHTQFGWHLILVRQRRAATAEDLPNDNGQTALSQMVFALVCGKGVHVHINPSYGTWDRSPCTGGQGLAKVAPPAGPAPGK